MLEMFRKNDVKCEREEKNNKKNSKLRAEFSTSIHQVNNMLSHRYGAFELDVKLEDMSSGNA